MNEVQSLSLYRPYAFTYNNFFYVLTVSFEMNNSQLRFQNTTEDNSIMWVDQETLHTVYIFVSEGSLNQTFNEVSPSSNWRLFPLKGVRGYAKSIMGVSSLSRHACFL